ncbi:MAG: hypothetical protein SGI74_07290 [Oligoflexia bacterium]|nr:hypothetical protein [Oligoflexia bacterium]
MNRSLLMALAILILCTGCNRPLSHPESVDPIYIDLKKDKDALLQKIRSEQKELAKTKQEYETAPIRSKQKQDAHSDYYRFLNKLDKMEENYRYLAIKTNSRLKEVRKIYPKVFEEKKPWPDTDEYSLYLVEKRLKNAPREWDPQNRIKKRLPTSASH